MTEKNPYMQMSLVGSYRNRRAAQHVSKLLRAAVGKKISLKTESSEGVYTIIAEIHDQHLHRETLMEIATLFYRSWIRLTPASEQNIRF